MSLIWERENAGRLNMTLSRRLGAARAVAAVSFLALLGAIAITAQQLDSSTVIRGVDAAVKARLDNVASYTVTEHYAVYRSGDETNPAAEMTVRTDYRRETGKSYTIVSQSGSEIIRRLVLSAILDNEKRINEPGNVKASWLISANYEMKLKPGGIQRLDERNCFALAITPMRKAPNMIEGTLWVDAEDGSIVRIEGTASQSPSIFTGPAHVMRQYADVSGFAMATYARAVSNSFLFGRTVVTVDYRDYQMQLRVAK
jgi:outer membrane lipoprotein-sorting protein